jgi:hypothetical protein
LSLSLSVSGCSKTADQKQAPQCHEFSLRKPNGIVSVPSRGDITA